MPQRDTLGPNEIPIGPWTPPRVVILDTATGAVMTTAAGNVPWHVGISPDGATIYVTSYEVRRFDAPAQPVHARVTGSTTVSRGFTTAFLSDSTRAYVAANENVYAVDTSTHTVVATIPFDPTVAGRALGVVTTPPPSVPPQRRRTSAPRSPATACR